MVNARGIRAMDDGLIWSLSCNHGLYLDFQSSLICINQLKMMMGLRFQGHKIFEYTVRVGY
jgi:hypothetical protein